MTDTFDGVVAYVAYNASVDDCLRSANGTRIIGRRVLGHIRGQNGRWNEGSIGHTKTEVPPWRGKARDGKIELLTRHKLHMMRTHDAQTETRFASLVAILANDNVTICTGVPGTLTVLRSSDIPSTHRTPRRWRCRCDVAHAGVDARVEGCD